MALTNRRGLGGGSATLLLLAAPATTACPSTASAAGGAKPELGRWEGSDAEGRLVSFRVMRVKGSGERAVAYGTYGCTVERLEVSPGPYGWGTELGDPLGADLDRPHASGIGKRGRLVHGNRSGSDSVAGKLGRRSGYVKPELGTWPGPCGEDAEARVRVHHVDAAVTPVSGAWQSLTAVGTFRFLVFGSVVEEYRGQALSGFGTLQGAAVPCVAMLGGFFGSVDVAAWTDPGGAYGWTAADARLDGQFDGPTGTGGSYVFPATFPQPSGATNCVDAELPFTATLEQAGPPPRWRGSKLVDASGPPPPPPPTLPTPTQPTQYVALGDSYSSGEGVPPFQEGTDMRGNRCHRSTRAYSQLLNPPGYVVDPRHFFACSGAITSNIGRLPAQGWTALPHEGEPPQLERLTLEQWRPIDLITLTIGGNDARFDKVLKRCLRPRKRCNHGPWAAEVERRIAQELPPLLFDTYNAVRSRVPIRQGPNATIVVFGYPQLFPGKPRGRCGFGKRLWLTEGEQDWLRERGEQLNDVIEAAAAYPDFRMHYVDVTNAFRGHEVCGRDGEWLHGLVPKVPPKHRYSFHPNGRGQRAYAERLVEYFSCLYQAGFGFRPSGVPFNPGGTNGLVVSPACIAGVKG